MGAIALELLTGSWNLIKMGFSALGSFLKSLDAQGWAGLIIGLFLAYTTFHQWSEARHWHKQSDRYQTLYTQDHKAFGQTVLNYRAAQAKAEAEDAAKDQRTKAQQAQVSQEKSDEYETRLAVARAEYQRLRNSSSGNLGSSPVPDVSGVSTSASGPDEATGQDGLPFVDQYTCTAQSIQLDELEKWVTAQHAIDPNAAIQPPPASR